MIKKNIVSVFFFSLTNFFILFFIFKFFMGWDLFSGQNIVLKKNWNWANHWLAMILKTVWSNCGSSNSMLFSHIEVLRVKRTRMMMSSWLTRSDCTIWSGFENHDGLSNSMLFSHIEVLRVKRTKIMMSSWLTRSDCTIWSRFENHDFNSITFFSLIFITKKKYINR